MDMNLVKARQQPYTSHYCARASHHWHPSLSRSRYRRYRCRKFKAKAQDVHLHLCWLRHPCSRPSGYWRWYGRNRKGSQGFRNWCKYHDRWFDISQVITMTVFLALWADFALHTRRAKISGSSSRFQPQLYEELRSS